MGFARLLANEGKQKGFKACAIDLEDLDPTTLATSTSLSIFVMATAGEGSEASISLF
jgi:sulfite reductase alpha subunit-like flavoprotein